MISLLAGLLPFTCVAVAAQETPTVATAVAAPAAASATVAATAAATAVRPIPGAAASYSGEKLSLNFQNIDVRSVLQVIGNYTGLNFVASDSVTGAITLRLKDVPWDQALDTILQAKGLSMRRSGEVVWVAPREEVLAREALELEARQKIADLEPVHTRAFQLNYAKAEAVARALGGQNLAPPPGGPGTATAAALAPLLAAGGAGGLG
ncbi:secretin and TonB N-terminal domain-containing protein, partial [Azohydromonas aeria]|uniref:secretin and TonB N-terminal domain-containing protein n=1 Tax=Azohydromonas aeria TaxID=2590212 RepID=UPI001E3F429E